MNVRKGWGKGAATTAVPSNTRPASAKLVACIASLALALSMGALAGCSSQESTTSAASSTQHTISYDPGSVSSDFGVQNWDVVKGGEAAAGEEVAIPDYSSYEYGVFVPGYWLTGWQRSDTGEIISAPFEEGPGGHQRTSSDSDEATSGDSSSAASESGSSDGSEESQEATFTMPDEDVTLTAQWEPMTTEVYVQEPGSDSATLAGTVSLNDSALKGSADDTSVWQSYNTFNQGEARVYTASFYYPLESIFQQANITVDPDDTVTLGESFLTDPAGEDSTSSVTHPWSYYTTGQFYPDTTCDTYNDSNATPVEPALALAYNEGRSTSKEEALSAVLQQNVEAGIHGQSSAMTPRALFGVPEDQYDDNANYKGSEHPYYVNQILITRAG